MISPLGINPMNPPPTHTHTHTDLRQVSSPVSQSCMKYPHLLLPLADSALL